MRILRHLLLLALFVTAPAGADHLWGDGFDTPKSSFDGIVSPPVAKDWNPDPDIVEVQIIMDEGVWNFQSPFGAGVDTQNVYMYNRTIPGPLIKAKVGDTLIVHFYNRTDQDTTIHWHGVETPANMDGSNIAQLAVLAGGYFRYEFPLLKAALFWYHPHIRTNEMIERGLYGTLLVKDPKKDAALGLPVTEHVWVLDDVMIGLDDQFLTFDPTDREEKALLVLNGREGEFQLTNGVWNPHVTLDRGIPHRIHFLNAANVRFMRVSFLDHPLYRIGGDQGLLNSTVVIQPAEAVFTKDLKHTADPDPTTGLTLTPGERADVILLPQEDTSFPLETPLDWHDIARGRHSVEFDDLLGVVTLAHNIPDGNRSVIRMARVHFEGPSNPVYSVPMNLGDNIQAIPYDLVTTPKLPLVMGHTIPNIFTGETIFFIQAMMKPFPVLTPDDVHSVMMNNTYMWEIRNLTGGHHNFHTHGFPFQHIETEFVDLDTPENNFIRPAEVLENKDTLLISRRPCQTRGRCWTITRLVVNFDDTGREGQAEAFGLTPTADESGGWLAHCHILEHSATGMMTFFQTFYPGTLKVAERLPAGLVLPAKQNLAQYLQPDSPAQMGAGCANPGSVICPRVLPQ